MRICILACPQLKPPLEEMGHEVLRLSGPEEGVELDLAEVLAREGFVPDLVVERESLGRRWVTGGLDELDCPVVYWSLDTHLNHFWQRRAVGRYDLAATIQPGWVPALLEAGAPAAEALALSGWKRDWRPWSGRSREAAFVGRITESRTVRRAMVELVASRHDLALHTDIPYARVPEAYEDARVAPNETIAREVNMRLFEASSCGCAVLSPARARDQELFFEPGREFLPYENGLDLLETLAWCGRNPDKAEAVGRRAWQRVQACHLPVHRAERLLDLVKELPGGRARGEEGERLRLLTLFEMWLGGRIDKAPETLPAALAGRGGDPDCVTALIVLLEWAGQREAALSESRRVAAEDGLARDPECAAVASAVALRAGDFGLARYLLAHCLRLREDRALHPPASTEDFWLSWAGLLQRAGLVSRQGFSMDLDRHLPASAVDCLMIASRDNPGGRASLRLAELLRRVPGTAFFRSGLLADLTLRRREDWRLGMDLGLDLLRMFRVQEGLEELALARNLAREAGGEKAFEERLARKNPGEATLRSLAAYG